MKESVDKKLKIETECPVCGGNGLFDKTDPCPSCGGSGICLRTLSPAELAEENLKALAVLEELKTKLKIWKLHAEKDDNPHDIRAMDDVLDEIESLESQAPVSELAKKAEENERKAEVLFELSAWLEPKKHGKYIKLLDVLNKMDKLLAQSKLDSPSGIPPKAGKESDE